MLTGVGNDFADESDVSIPRPLVPLRLTDGTFLITITQIIDDLEFTGDDYAYIQPISAGGGPDTSESDGSEFTRSFDEVLQFERVPPTDEKDHELPIVRKIRTERNNYRVSVPKRYLGEVGLGIDIEDYDRDDPFIFFPIANPDEPSQFHLEPLGRVSELFVPQSRFTPFPEGLTGTAAEQVGINEGILAQSVQRVRSLGPGLIDAPSVDGTLSTDYSPIVFDRQGRRYAIHFTQPGALLTLFRWFYGLDPEHANAIHWMHQVGAGEWLTEIYKSEGKAFPPEDGPVAKAYEGDLDTAIIPISEDGRDWPFAIDVARSPSELAVDPDRVTVTQLHESDVEDLPGVGDSTPQTDVQDFESAEANGEEPDSDGPEDVGLTADQLVDLVFPPAEIQQVQTAFGVDMVPLRHALEDIQRITSVEDLEASEIGQAVDRASLTMEVPPEAELEEYVLTLVFVEKEQFPQALDEFTADDTIADAVRSVHNRFAEDLIQRAQPGGDYLSYSFDSDAVVLVEPAE